MVAGYLAPNPSRNANIAGGIRFYFRESGQVNFGDLGSITDVNKTPGTEFFVFNSTHGGRLSEAKKVLQTRSLEINLTAQETTPMSLRFGLFGGDEETGSINIPATATPVRSSGTFTLSETTIVGVIEVRSEDGDTLYEVSTDYTVSGNVITIVPSGNLDVASPNDGDKVHVLYRVQLSGATTRKFELLDNTEVIGAAQFHVRNQDGGLAQIYEFDQVQISPDGSISFADDDVQTIPLLVSCQELNGQFGRVYYTDIS